MGEAEDLVRVSSKHRDVAHLWLTHLGFSEEEIAEGEKAVDHGRCVLTDLGWDCIGASGESNHELADRIGCEIAVVGEILELSKFYNYYLAATDVLEADCEGAQAAELRARVVARLGADAS